MRGMSGTPEAGTLTQHVMCAAKISRIVHTTGWCVAPRAKLPCASGTHTAQEAGTRSPHARRGCGTATTCEHSGGPEPRALVVGAVGRAVLLRLAADPLLDVVEAVVVRHEGVEARRPRDLQVRHRVARDLVRVRVWVGIRVRVRATVTVTVTVRVRVRVRVSVQLTGEIQSLGKLTKLHTLYVG